VAITRSQALEPPPLSRQPRGSAGRRAERSATPGSLEPVGRIASRPYALRENDDIAFQGSNVLGLGFTLTPKQAAALIALDLPNLALLQPKSSSARTSINAPTAPPTDGSSTSGTGRSNEPKGIPT